MAVPVKKFIAKLSNISKLAFVKTGNEANVNSIPVSLLMGKKNWLTQKIDSTIQNNQVRVVPDLRHLANDALIKSDEIILFIFLTDFRYNS